MANDEKDDQQKQAEEEQAAREADERQAAEDNAKTPAQVYAERNRERLARESEGVQVVKQIGGDGLFHTVAEREVDRPVTYQFNPAVGGEDPAPGEPMDDR